ncbi:MAG: hypothetical protein AAB626_01360 [Patescibacteria group bacterium]
MKRIAFLTKKEKGGVTIYSADKKIEYAFLRKIQDGRIIRIFFYEPICDGIMAEGTAYPNLERAVEGTKTRIEEALKSKKR